MNWGKAIVLVFIVFAGFIGTMVFRMSRQRIDLVRDDYYQDEIAYQQHIDRLARTAHLKQGPVLQIDPARQQLDLRLPSGWTQGQLTFYRPADRAQDRTITLSPGQQTISTADLGSGRWRAQVSWSAGGQTFYHEQSFTKP
ncbi:FixH family protein [Spirosoma sordidisoli]|uniref:Nitrogen fixation protein FixH n=1 Tax=Spirosoma sordidisoli TaxID=2502893 RepID=A0A4Q2UK18_9BACT|nr:FixH family protein [Spirosoma sordidisoli]RYC68982.1 nitrogen fixation protein FixH [Spirosoma sordidisoli]